MPKPGYIADYAGRLISLTDPQVEDITLDAIEVGLENIARFGGQSKTRYSVKQHSVNVYKIMKYYIPDLRPDYARQALFHDAQEAYIGDVVRPLKMLLHEYQQIEESWARVIAQRFNFPEKWHLALKTADNTALLLEARYVGRDFPHGAREHWPMIVNLSDSQLFKIGVHVPDSSVWNPMKTL